MLKRILLMIALISLFSAAKAVADVDGGVNIDWNHPRDANREDFGIGARVDFGGQIRGQLAFDYIFQNADDIFGPGEVNSDDFNLKFWELNANLLYQFPTETVHPYLGAGLGFARRTFDDTITDVFDNKRTEFGVNALGGIKFGHHIEPFIEARYTWYPNKRAEIFGIDPDNLGARLRFHDRFVLAGGILF